VPPLAAGDNQQTPLAFMLATMRDAGADARVRLDAAKAAAIYMHQKLGEGGKKEERQGAAKVASRGKFAPGAAPKLVAVR